MPDGASASCGDVESGAFISTMKVTRFDGRLPEAIPDGCESYRTNIRLLLIGG
jgi:hypothetical protein